MALSVRKRHAPGQPVALQAALDREISRALLPLWRDGEAQRVAAHRDPRNGSRAAGDADELANQRLAPRAPDLDPRRPRAVGCGDGDVPAPDDLIRGSA